jgi:leader peptidase (prepilin peptidase)/N-methyltransferase
MVYFLAIVFLLLVGACVGSFLNVVIYRLPEGQSLVSPGSACPRCGHKLAWHDNVPVLGWLWLKGRCRYCQAPISPQYPIVELGTALLFGGLTWWYYFSGFRPELGELWESWPVLGMHLVLAAGLLAATVVDLRSFLIPITLPWLITAAAVLWYPLSATMGWLPATLLQAPPVEQMAPVASFHGVGAAIGGVMGLGLALALVWLGVLPRSFDEPAQEEADVPNDPAQWAVHPHPRREASKELLFVLFPLMGLLLGTVLIPEPVRPYTLTVRVLSGVVTGYLVGGGLVWVTRILGTLAFGKEAMGLGDVHLVGAIGAVLGGLDVVFVFFVAPFVGLTAALGVTVFSLMKRAPPRVVPYGPSLAAAALVMMLFRRPILIFFEVGL